MIRRDRLHDVVVVGRRAVPARQARTAVDRDAGGGVLRDERSDGIMVEGPRRPRRRNLSTGRREEGEAAALARRDPEAELMDVAVVAAAQGREIAELRGTVARPGRDVSRHF
jgi:hypothetical protein